MKHITAPLKEQIRSNNEEIKRLTSLNEKLNDALVALTGSKDEETEVEPVREKRKYIKRAARWKKNKSKKKPSHKKHKVNGETKNLSWKDRLPEFIEKKGKVVNTEDVIRNFYPSAHHKTAKVLKKRIDSILYLYARKGTLKCHGNGSEKYYGLPEMFSGSTVLETCKP